MTTTLAHRPRSITHGTCALNGQHPPGSPYARECPGVRRPRDAKNGPGAHENEGGAIPLQPPGEGAASALANSRTSDTVSRDIATGRAFRPGRPRLADGARLQRWRERKRRWRTDTAAVAQVNPLTGCIR